MANNVKAWQPSACFAGFVVMLWLSTPPALKGIRQSGIGAVIPASVASNATATTGKPSQPLPTKEELTAQYKACFPDTAPPPLLLNDIQKFNDFVFECSTAKRQGRPISKPMRELLNQAWNICFKVDPKRPLPRGIANTPDQVMAELVTDCQKP